MNCGVDAFNNAVPVFGFAFDDRTREALLKPTAQAVALDVTPEVYALKLSDFPLALVFKYFRQVSGLTISCPKCWWRAKESAPKLALTESVSYQ